MTWITWNGGKCPVEPETVVEVILRCDAFDVYTSDPTVAEELRWSHHMNGADIIAYTTETPAFVTAERFAEIVASASQCDNPQPPEKPFSTRIIEAEEKALEAVSEMVRVVNQLMDGGRPTRLTLLDQASCNIEAAAALARDYARKEG